MASIGADGPNIEGAFRCQVSQLCRLPPKIGHDLETISGILKTLQNEPDSVPKMHEVLSSLEARAS
jgi:hypothetical protein